MEYIFIAIIFVMAVFPISTSMIDAIIAPKLYFTALSLTIMVMLFSLRSMIGKKMRFETYGIAKIICVICAIEAFYSIFSASNYIGTTALVGHFDNPAGLISCLCSGLPFGYILFDKREWKGICLISILAVVLSKSRIGVIVVAVCIFMYCLNYVRLSNFLKTIVLTLFCVLIACSLYFINTGSVHGRLLVWQSVWPMVVDTPFSGHGIGCFERLYMDYQAVFLSGIKDNAMLLLADEVVCPFNEYIRFYICFGGCGTLILGGFVISLLKAYFADVTKEKAVAMTSLAIVAFISLFSYPFTYPFTYLICMIDAYIILKDSFTLKYFKIKKILLSVCILIALCLFMHTARLLYYNVIWQRASNEKNLDVYAVIYPFYKNNAAFLYNYAFELNRQQRYVDGLEVAKKCATLLSSYDLNMLIGELLINQGDFTGAEPYYVKASMMCPCRFLPLYKLFYIYETTHSQLKQVAIAERIDKQVIKVVSPEVNLIKYKIRCFLMRNSINP